LGEGQQFVTKPCKNIGICTVLRYEWGGGLKIRKNMLRIMWTFPKGHLTLELSPLERLKLLHFGYTPHTHTTDEPFAQKSDRKSSSQEVMFFLEILGK
jgi:hypothetical protein